MTLALHGKSRRRRTWLLFAALLAVVFGVSGSLMLTRDETKASSTTITFESPTYTTGNIHGQDGWSKTGPFDVAVVAHGGGQALRISNSTVSGSFTDQTFSKSLVDEAGELTAQNGGMSGGTRQGIFEAQWDFESADPSNYQPGLQIVANPDRGDGARMSYVRMSDQPSGLAVSFYDYQAGPGPTYTCSNSNFIFTNVATGLDRTQVHTVKVSMQLLNGRGNDIVRVFVDGVLKHTGTSWEDYFRDCEGNPSRTVDSILFRAGGTPGIDDAPGSLGKGFVIDNLNMTSSPAAAVPTTTTVVKASDLTTPIGGGWLFYDDNTDAYNNTPGVLGSFVAGPAGQPLGNGSAQVVIPAGGRTALATYQFAGTPLANITQLKFSAYNSPSAVPGSPVYLNFNVDFNLSDAWQNRLVFVPTGVVANTWQEFDAIQGGAAMWTYSKPGFWPAPNGAVPNTTPLSWNQILNDYPNVRIRVSDPHLGVRVGHPGPAQTANIDKFVFGTSTAIKIFDFDPGCTTVCYVRKTGSDSNDGSSPATAKLTIQAGINAVNAGGTVDVGPGTYNEDVTITPTQNGITLQGAGIDTTTILGTKGPGASVGNSLYLAGTTNVVVDGLTVTRDGNNPADWNAVSPALNNWGVNISNGSGNTLQNSKVTGNRNGVYIESSTNTVIQNNIIDFNRTGVVLVNTVNGTNIHNNFITNNWTIGVLGRNEVSLNTTSNVSVNNNSISGNWYSQIELRAGFASASPTLNFENNWLGTLTPTLVTAGGSGEEGYSTQIPAPFGSTLPPVPVPFTATVVRGDVLNTADYDPFLCSGTDVAPATVGFQPLFDCGDIDVTSTSAYVGDTNVQVQVRANSVESLWGVQTYLTYDNTRLTLTGVQLGGGLDPDYVAVNANSPGLISFAFSQTSGSPVTGTNIVIATLTFTATNTGAAVIGYQGGQTQLFSNNLGQPMGPLTKLDGTVTITNAPAGTGDISGTILLQGRTNHTGATAEINPGPFPAVGSPLSTTTSIGAYTIIAAPQGSVTVRARMLGYLLANHVMTVVAGSNPGGTVTLIGGDANMSGNINILDLSLIAAYFGQSPAYSPAPAPNTTPDINGDNVVNILDLSLTAANFGAVGPTSW